MNDLDDFSTPPSLPLKVRGNIRHLGWEIPTMWAVDAEGICWMNDGFGSPMKPCTSTDLLKMAEQDEVSHGLIANALGIPHVPAWQVKALAAGWRPPKG